MLNPGGWNPCEYQNIQYKLKHHKFVIMWLIKVQSFEYKEISWKLMFRKVHCQIIFSTCIWVTYEKTAAVNVHELEFVTSRYNILTNMKYTGVNSLEQTRKNRGMVLFTTYFLLQLELNSTNQVNLDNPQKILIPNQTSLLTILNIYRRVSLQPHQPSFLCGQTKDTALSNYLR